LGGAERGGRGAERGGDPRRLPAAHEPRAQRRGARDPRGAVREPARARGARGGGERAPAEHGPLRAVEHGARAGGADAGDARAVQPQRDGDAGVSMSGEGLSRRAWLRWGAAAAAGSVLPGGVLRAGAARAAPVAKAKRVVYLFQAGGPSQLESFDYKPGLAELRGTELPASVRGSARITSMTAGQGQLNVASSLVR